MTPEQSYTNTNFHRHSGSGGKGGTFFSSAGLRTGGSLNQYSLMKPDPILVSKLLREESDQRYRYLIRNGNLHFVEQETLTLYVELPQIPNVIIVYRRPSERTNNAEKLALE